MRKPTRFALELALAVVLAPACVACGGEREQRGLAPGTEQAVPADAQDLGETGKERRKEIVGEMNKESQEHFDDAEQDAP